MKKSEIALGSFLNAAGVLFYVMSVAWVLSNGERLFGGREPRLVIPVFMMLLLVISATITGLLVFGRPVLLYLDGRKKEALHFFFATLGWLVCILFGVVAVLMLK